MPQGIAMQFFTQQCESRVTVTMFHTYSQWFAANFIFQKFQ